MSNETLSWAAGVAVVAVVAAGAYYYTTSQVPTQQAGKPAAVAMAPLPVPVATPAGITLQFMGRNAQGYAEQDHLMVVLQPDVAYADAKGLTLYTYDKDAPGKSNCTGDCTQTFIPAAAPATAKADGVWSIVARDDGSKQWALDGKPLYTFAKDKLPGESGGNDAGHRDEAGTNYKHGYKRSPAVVQPPDGHVAMFQTGPNIALPHGISIQSVGDANGVVLVDVRGMTLYEFEGRPDEDKPACATPPCDTPWTPLAAPALANPVGDFTAVNREDGIRQWTYKGRALYTYEGDLQPTFANGSGVDKRFHVASIVQHFLPTNVRIGPTPGLGAVLTTADGKTLYRRDGFAFQSGGGHSFRHGVPNRPAVGRMIGTKGCDAECQKIWHPLLAPGDAVPQGYWEVATREDGSKQWMYQGYALYTYDGDKRPGDMTGNDIYDIALSDDPNKVIDVGPQMTGTAALYWAVAAP